MASTEKFHFIGIGGVGMSGIAHVAADQGYIVSGSDLRESKYTQLLEHYGVDVHIGHSPDNIPAGNPVVVVSTAILPNNPELIAAKERGLEIWHRAKTLSFLGKSLDTLAVAGTHGKTTTSSMVAYALDKLGADPTFLIGGIVRSYGGNARSGKGNFYVVEADESDKSFTYLSPKGIILTNIEADHLDHYASLEEICGKFTEFISLLPDDGVVTVCADQKNALEAARAAGKRMLTYGFAGGADVRVCAYEPRGIGSAYILQLGNGQRIEGHLQYVPGAHNVVNAAGVVALLMSFGFDAKEIVAALSTFSGVKRRFEFVDEVDGVTIVDDYAHHPTEIAATIAAAKNMSFKHVHVLFQPHRYSRAHLFVEVLHDEFGRAFDLADSVTFMDVYPAGETPIPGVSGKTFLQPIMEHAGHPEQVGFVQRRIDTVDYMLALASPGDLIITMGAGDVTDIGPQIADALRNRHNESGSANA